MYNIAEAFTSGWNAGMLPITSTEAVKQQQIKSQDMELERQESALKLQELTKSIAANDDVKRELQGLMQTPEFNTKSDVEKMHTLADLYWKRGDAKNATEVMKSAEAMQQLMNNSDLSKRAQREELIDETHSALQTMDTFEDASAYIQDKAKTAPKELQPNYEALIRGLNVTKDDPVAFKAWKDKALKSLEFTKQAVALKNAETNRMKEEATSKKIDALIANLGDTKTRREANSQVGATDKRIAREDKDDANAIQQYVKAKQDFEKSKEPTGAIGIAQAALDEANKYGLYKSDDDKKKIEAAKKNLARVIKEESAVMNVWKSKMKPESRAQFEIPPEQPEPTKQPVVAPAPAAPPPVVPKSTAPVAAANVWPQDKPIPMSAIADLKANPKLAEQFNEFYGHGKDVASTFLNTKTWAEQQAEFEAKKKAKKAAADAIQAAQDKAKKEKEDAEAASLKEASKKQAAARAKIKTSGAYRPLSQTSTSNKKKYLFGDF